MLKWFRRRPDAPTQEVAQEPSKLMSIRSMALDRASRKNQVVMAHEPYSPPPGVIPDFARDSALAQDRTPYDYVNQEYVNTYFPGYQYLSMLAQLPEYRKFAEIPAKDMTRKWIKVKAKGEGDDKSDKIAQIEAAMERFELRDKFRKVAEYDQFYGRGQLYIDILKPDGSRAGDDYEEVQTKLIRDPRKIKKGSLKGFYPVEPIWTYPSGYNAIDPLAHNFYKPHSWFVMGKTVHHSRLLTFVSRPVPDLLKASYNFGGLSMSQMAQPYVQNWLRTRDSVSDMVHSYSVSGVKTNLSGVLYGTDDSQFQLRADLFNKLRDNRGLMLLDKDSEDFFQFSTPLSGLGELQEQALEQLSAISSIPLVKLLGVTPSGLNASSDGEIQVYYDTIHSLQEALFREPLWKCLQIIQLSEFGEIDEDITFDFEPLWEMSEVEAAQVRKAEADTDAVYVQNGVLAPDEIRERLANDPDSGYDNLAGNAPELDMEGAEDADPMEEILANPHHTHTFSGTAYQFQEPGLNVSFLSGQSNDGEQDEKNPQA